MTPEEALRKARTRIEGHFISQKMRAEILRIEEDPKKMILRFHLSWEKDGGGKSTMIFIIDSDGNTIDAGV